MSYTASYLSFMFENLRKSVIITGSQVPIFEPRTDGKDNFISSLILAGNYVIPEVCLFFNSKLFRGNRTIKMSPESFAAFDSPNFLPLARIGVNIEVDSRLIFRPSSTEEFQIFTQLNENVGILRIFPNISTETVRAFLQPPMKGVVMQSFGAGNVQSNRPDLAQVFKEATNRGIIIINVTQCVSGSVAAKYETGAFLYECGVISGSNMVTEKLKLSTE